MIFVKSIFRALILPPVAPGVPALLRRVCSGRRVLGLISTFLQLLDFKRQQKITSKFQSDDPYFQRVQSYNADVTLVKQITTTRRMEDFFRILALPGRDVSREKILHIGPRDIHEMLMAWAYGFTWKNIHGIDLYSTNPKIQVMNMEQMSFADGEFDAVVLAQTLAYAKDTEKCLAEVVRVLRPGGRAAFGATYTSNESEWAGNRVSGAKILDMLRRLPVEIYYYRPQDKINALGSPQTSHAFGIVKLDPSKVRHDRVDLLRIGAIA